MSSLLFAKWVNLSFEVIMLIESQPRKKFVVSQNGSTTLFFMSGGNQKIALGYGHAVWGDYRVPVF